MEANAYRVLSGAVVIALCTAGAPIGCSTSTTAERGPSETSVAESAEEEAPDIEESAADLALPNMERPYEGIVTAGQPTKAQFRRLPDAGINTVINFRSPREEGAWDEASMAEGLGLEYVNIPITSAEDLSRDKVERFDDLLRKEDGNFLVHCRSSNRVGAMFALRAYWFLDKSPEEALEIGKEAGLTGLEGAVRDKIRTDGHRSD